jgi:hypothetical protein
MEREHTRVDVGQYTALGDSDVTQELVQFLIVADGKLEMARDDTGLLVVASGIASKLKDFGSEVLEDGSKIDGSSGTDALSIVALAQKTMDTTNGESETSFGRATEAKKEEVSDTHNMKLGSRERKNIRLRGLAASSLSTGLSASHFEG